MIYKVPNAQLEPRNRKDLLRIIGNMAALAHVPAPDEILKNSFENQAFENFEIAAYGPDRDRGAAGPQRVIASFQQSLQEEVRMAARIAKLIRPTTLQYLDRASAGERRIADVSGVPS